MSHTRACNNLYTIIVINSNDGRRLYNNIIFNSKIPTFNRNMYFANKKDQASKAEGTNMMVTLYTHDKDAATVAVLSTA